MSASNAHASVNIALRAKLEHPPTNQASTLKLGLARDLSMHAPAANTAKLFARINLLKVQSKYEQFKWEQVELKKLVLGRNLALARVLLRLLTRYKEQESKDGQDA